jgi:uncharacterized LabA/DUF88 family protein
MHDAGYAVVLKPTFDMTRPRIEDQDEESGKDRPHHNGHNGKPEDKKPVKGNIDAELVLWAMKEMSNYDKAIIVSGDGDFYCLVEYLEEKKRLLRLLTPSGHYSSLYNRYEDYVVRLDTYKKELRYHDFKRKRSAPDKKN